MNSVLDDICACYNTYAKLKQQYDNLLQAQLARDKPSQRCTEPAASPFGSGATFTYTKKYTPKVGVPILLSKGAPVQREWNSYYFYERGQDGQIHKQEVKRERPNSKLKRIIKKMYNKLLLVLHPDRSTIPNSEKICNILLENYKIQITCIILYVSF